MPDMKNRSLSPPSAPAVDLPVPHGSALNSFAQLTAMALQADIALVELGDRWGVWHSVADQATQGMSIAAREAANDSPPSAAASRQLSNPLVAGEDGFAFYACVPLRIDHVNLGKLVIVSRSPRDVGTEEMALLRQLADVIVDAFPPQVAAFRRLRRA